MTDKIDGTCSVPRQQASLASALSSGSSSRSGESRPVGNVQEDGKVRLTDNASALYALERKLSEAPAMDMERVAAVRAAIESGSYHSDPREIASRLIALEKQLGR